MKRELRKTDDGSSTIYIEEMNEHYHSNHGAIQEAIHVFIENGLKSIDKKQFSVFELGFGTGLNALLTLQFAGIHQKTIFYQSIEAFPVEEELVKGLNYCSLIDAELATSFELLHTSKWEEREQITTSFELLKTKSKIQDFEIEKDQFDIVFFDAFGFRAQGEMWDISVLSKMYEMLRNGGILVTYAARGQFKRDLKSLGFKVVALPGPPGKREMTTAIKI